MISYYYQNKNNSIANTLELVFPELTHRYYLQQHKAKRKSYMQRQGDTELLILPIRHTPFITQFIPAV